MLVGFIVFYPGIKCITFFIFIYYILTKNIYTKIVIGFRYIKVNRLSVMSLFHKCLF